MKNFHTDPALEARRQMEQNNPYMNQSDDLLAKVIAFHSASGTVDVAIDGSSHQGGIYRNVPILSWSYGTQTGHTYMPSNIKLAASMPSASGPYDQPIPSGEQDVWCVIAHLNGRSQRPVCLGFYSPTQSQIHTKDLGYEVKLHESGVYSVTDPSGNVTVGLPDGSTIVIGTSSTPVDMTAQNANWNPQTTSNNYQVTMNFSGPVTINAPKVYLGTSEGGGKAVARVGDTVNLTTGEIEGGSSNVFSA